MMGVNKGHPLITLQMLQYFILKLQCIATICNTTRNYKCCYTKLQAILQKLTDYIIIIHEATDGTTLNYRQNYMHMHYTQTK